MLARAIQKNVKISSKKACLVCDLIRNKSVSVALKILDNQPQKAAKFLYKLVASAASNAINNHSMKGDDLYIFHTVANQAKTLKRSFPRAKGRTDLRKKRNSHLVVIVSDDSKEREKINKYLLKPRAHQHKYKDKKLDAATEIRPKKIFSNNKINKKQ